jgi:hypothetical protein
MVSINPTRTKTRIDRTIMFTWAAPVAADAAAAEWVQAACLSALGPASPDRATE